jgi:hypothetical protein
MSTTDKSPEQVPPGYLKVRTTMRPQEPLVVSESEALDLQRQGLLVTDNAETRKLTETEKGN